MPKRDTGRIKTIKAATVNYSAQLAQNWGRKGIRSNSVSPGPIYIEGANGENVVVDGGFTNRVGF